MPKTKPNIVVIVHSFSGANRLYKNAATNRTGYEMSIALVGISTLNISAQYTTMGMLTAVVVIPQIEENHTGIIDPPYHQNAEVDLLGSLYIRPWGNARSDEGIAWDDVGIAPYESKGKSCL